MCSVYLDAGHNYCAQTSRPVVGTEIQTCCNVRLLFVFIGASLESIRISGSDIALKAVSPLIPLPLVISVNFLLHKDFLQTTT